jgi:hypothetical protein
MNGAVSQKPRQAVVEILDFMRRNRIALDDLLSFGGEDLRASNPKRATKARLVEKTWALMAQLSVKFADLEQTPPPIPNKSARRRRHRRHSAQAVEITSKTLDASAEANSNEINDLANSAPVGVPDSNREPAS